VGGKIISPRGEKGRDGGKPRAGQRDTKVLKLDKFSTWKGEKIAGGGFEGKRGVTAEPLRRDGLKGEGAEKLMKVQQNRFEGERQSRKR